MDIAVAEGDADIRAGFEVMRHLRDVVDPEDFLNRVRRLQAAGYRLVVLRVDGRGVAAAGYRIGENLAWGRHLYVDDLVTLPEERSRGHGRALLAWLVEMARAQGCDQLHLDSRAHRADAHRFYEREGLQGSSIHFWRSL